MAHLRGVEVGKILTTEADVIEHCYPQLHKRMQDHKDLANAETASAPTPPPAPVASSKKPKKAKAEAKVDVEAKTEEAPAFTDDTPPPPPEGSAEYDPFKEA